MAASDHTEGCARQDCTVGSILDRPHLRVQLSPPDQPWTMVRVCDLMCLQHWLEGEAESREPVVFKREEWIDSHG